MKRDNILIVDDNAGIRTTLQILLDGKCAAVETIASPKVLVSTVQRFRPDVILLDMNFNTGFDLTKLKMSTTQVSATYDLHCFNIAVSWVPTGQWQSYSFRIAANASALADLLRFKKSSSYMDNLLR